MATGVALPEGVHTMTDDADSDRQWVIVIDSAGDVRSIGGTFEKKSNPVLGVYYEHSDSPGSVIQYFAGNPMTYKVTIPGPDSQGTVAPRP